MTPDAQRGISRALGSFIGVAVLFLSAGLVLWATLWVWGKVFAEVAG